MMKLLKIGELAKLAGVSVRTLHHYDRIGLLQTTANRESGHRLYSQYDVERLQQIISLKSIGLSLGAIGKCLDEEAYDLFQTLKIQEEVIKLQIEKQNQAHQTLLRMIDKLENEETLSTRELFEFMQKVKTMEKYYTAEQLETLRQRENKYRSKAEQVKNAWPGLFKRFAKLMEQGCKETDLKVQILAVEAQHYIDLFTGGDREIEKNFEKYAKENKHETLERVQVSEEVYDFAERARANIKKLR
jgi:DNA-binding transcriptional MerR regulator